MAQRRNGSSPNTHRGKSALTIKITGHDWGAAPGPHMDWGSHDIELMLDGRREYLHCPSADGLNYQLQAIRATLSVILGVEFEWPMLPGESREGEDRAVTSVYDRESGMIATTSSEIYGERIENGESYDDRD